MLVQLPNGLLEGLDLFNYAEVDELRGKQQNYLANRELVVGNVGHVPKILEDCISCLQTKEGVKWQGKMSDAVSKLSMGDIETLLIKIRENTYGGRFYFEAECEHCGHLNKNLRIDLDQLALDVMPPEMLVDKSRLTFMLPRAQKEAEVRPLYLKDIFESIKIGKDKREELITSVLALSLKRLGENNNVTPKDTEKLSARDMLFLKEELEKVKVEGTIDTHITHNCSNCKKDFTVKLDVLSSDFFDPTKGSMTSTL